MSKKRELLTKFINRDLSEEEEKEFIRIAATNEEFRRALIRETELNELVENLYSSNQREDLKLHQKNSKRSLLKNKIFKFVSLSAAAIIILSLALWSVFKPGVQTSNNNDLFNEYYSILQVDPIRSSSEFIEDSLYSLFLDGRYKLICSISKQINPDIEIIDLHKILFGISFIENKQFNQAIVEFNKVSDSSIYYPTASWYLSLIYIKEKKYGEAINTLQIAENSLILLSNAVELKEKVHILMKEESKK